MRTHSEDPSDAIMETIVLEETHKAPKQDISNLLAEFNAVKTKSSSGTDGLTKGFTLAGMDSVNELVSDAMQKIDEFTTNGAEQSFLQRSTSKALAVVGGKNSWLGKWADKVATEQRTEQLNAMTINEIVDELITNVGNKREEVILFIEEAVKIKQSMIVDISTYEELLTRVQTVVSEAAEHSRELFDSKQLLVMLTATIEGLKTNIKSQVDPLIVAASMSVEKIGALLPTIENDLKYTTGFKAFQQKLSDLNGMVTAVTELTTSAGDVIRKDINESVYSAIELVGKTSIDVKRLRQIDQQETAHQKRINEVVNRTQKEANQNFEDMKQLQLEQQQNREKTTNLLIENYAESTMSTKSMSVETC